MADFLLIIIFTAWLAIVVDAFADFLSEKYHAWTLRRKWRHFTERQLESVMLYDGIPLSTAMDYGYEHDAVPYDEWASLMRAIDDEESETRDHR